jgi:transposase
MPAQHRSELSEAECGRILALHDEGYTERYIASKLGCAPSTVHKIKQRFEKHHTYSALPRSGRPTNVSDRTRRHVLRVILAHRFWSYQQVADQVGGINAKAVQKIANKEGYRRCVAVTKPGLKPPMVTKRLTWAGDNTGRNWRAAIWCDESAISTDCDAGRLMVTRRPGEEYLPECLVSSYYSG